MHLSAGICSSPDEVSGWVGNSFDWQRSGNELLPIAMKEISTTTWRHRSPALDNAPVPLGRSLQHVLGNHALHGRVQRVPPAKIQDTAGIWRAVHGLARPKLHDRSRNHLVLAMIGWCLLEAGMPRKFSLTIVEPYPATPICGLRTVPMWTASRRNTGYRWRIPWPKTTSHLSIRLSENRH